LVQIINHMIYSSLRNFPIYISEILRCKLHCKLHSLQCNLQPKIIRYRNFTTLGTTDNQDSKKAKLPKLLLELIFFSRNQFQRDCNRKWLRLPVFYYRIGYFVFMFIIVLKIKIKIKFIQTASFCIQISYEDFFYICFYIFLIRN
jgi:hypothetical protein